MPATCAGLKVRCAVCKEMVYVPARDKANPSGPAGPASAPKGPSGLPASEPGGSETVEGSGRHAVPPPLPAKQEPAESTPPEPTAGPPTQGPTRPRGPRGRPRSVLAPVYRPDEGKRTTVKWLAFLLGLVVVFSLFPVFYLRYLNLAAAPGWARIVLLVAVVEAAYIAWMLNAPDWASVWVVMLVFAAASAVYATAAAYAVATVVATPAAKPMLLGMDEVRGSAGAWCGSVLSAMALATYLCGRTATRWRRTFELETAGRRKPDG